MSRRTVVNAALAVASVVCVVAIVELALQLADFPPRRFSPWISSPDTGFRLAAGLRTRMRRPPEYDVEFTTNESGLRDDPVTEKRGYRILLLGDSFTSGYGVERGELFADLLEHDLGVEVINAGVGGYEIVHQVHYYRSRGSALEPDLVVYMLYLGNDISRNDEWRETAGGGLEALDREYPVRPRREIKLLRLLGQARYQLRERADRLRGEWEPYDDYLAMCAREPEAAATADYRLTERYLRELRDVVEASGSELLVVMFSYSTAVDPRARDRFAAKTPGFGDLYDLDQPERRVGAMLAAAGIRFASLNPVLRTHIERGTDDPLYFPIDGHFTATGHRVVADALGPIVRAAIARSRAGARTAGD